MKYIFYYKMKLIGRNNKVQTTAFNNTPFIFISPDSNNNPGILVKTTLFN